MPTKALLSVPKLWELPESFKMATAAKEAGVDRVDILFEPQCAAAYLLDDIIKQGTLTACMKAGSIIVVADPGGGTGDFVPYEIVRQGDLNFDLQQVGTARGSLYSSEFVDFRFFSHLRTVACEKDGLNETFKERCDLLGRSEQDIYKISMDAFEPHKRDFAEDANLPMLIGIGGGPGRESLSWTVHISCAEMRCFFQPVIDEIIKQIDESLNELRELRKKATHIAIVGGMRGSSFFMSQVNSKYSASYKIIGDGDEMFISTHAVAHGSHLRYKDIKRAVLNPKGCFGIEQDEVFDEHRHYDVVRSNPRHSQEIDGYEYSKRRWQPSDEESGDLWQLRYVRPGQQEMKQQIWWTRDQIPKGSPMLDEEGTHVRAAFARLGQPIVKKCPDWEAEGFERHYLEENDPVEEGWDMEEDLEYADKINDRDDDMDYSDYSDDDDDDQDSDCEMFNLVEQNSRHEASEEHADGADGATVDRKVWEMRPDTKQNPQHEATEQSPDGADGAMVDQKVPELRPDNIFAPTADEERTIMADAEIDPMDEFIEGVDVRGETRDGRQGVSKVVYEVWSRFRIVSDGANVSAEWVVAKPGTQPFDAFGKPKKGKGKDVKAIKGLGPDVIELVNDAFSPYARG